MSLQLLPLSPQDLPQFKSDMQCAFQQGAAEYGFPPEEEILPEAHIDASLNSPAAMAYKALLEGEMVGGAIVTLDPESRSGHLDFLYVKSGCQGHGIGKFLWFAIEEKHPEISLWETCTPDFEKRNIHFYVNVCRFAIVEYFHAGHPDPHAPEGMEEDGMFAFRKELKR